MKIFLIRHGEQQYPYNDQGRKLISSPDAPLAELGRIQLQELGKKIAEEGMIPDVLYVSPILRAQQSADILVDVVSIANKFTVDKLKEVFPNSAEGKTFEEWEAIRGDVFAHPLGKDQESLEHLFKRTKEAIKSILVDAKKRGYKSIGIVGHGDPLCVLSWILKHKDLPSSYYEMKNEYYPQKGQAYIYSISSGKGRIITTEAAIQTFETFRSPKLLNF